MKSEKLLEAMNFLDDEDLTEAEAYTKEEKIIYNKKTAKKSHKAALSLAAAVVLILALGITAAAVGYNIYQQRQQQLREDMAIDVNNVQSYTEFDAAELVPTQDGTGIVILSAIKDGETETVFFSIAPVEEYEVEQCICEELMFACSLNGGESFSEARPHMDLSGLAAEDWETVIDPMGNEIRAVSRSKLISLAKESYDPETKSLVLGLSIPCNSVETDLSEPQNLSVTSFDLTKLDKGNGTVSLDAEEKLSYGSVILPPVETDCISLSFPSPLEFENAETGGKGQLLGADIYPTGISFRLRHDGMEKLYYTSDGEEPLPMDAAKRQEEIISWDGAVMSALSDARINLADGSSKSFPGGAAAILYDGEEILWPCSWAGTIDLSKVTSITIGGQNVTIK